MVPISQPRKTTLRVRVSLPPSFPSRPSDPRATFAPFHRTLNPPSGSSLSSPAPSNHPLRSRARSHPSLFALHPSLRCTTAVPDILCSLYPSSFPPTDPTHLRPPWHPPYPFHPSLYSIPMLYRFHPRQSPSPLPPSGAPTQPNANHPLKVGAPYWRLNHPARGRGDGTGRAEGRAGGWLS